MTDEERFCQSYGSTLEKKAPKMIINDGEGLVSTCQALIHKSIVDLAKLHQLCKEDVSQASYALNIPPSNFLFLS
jgi:hypothetical protein